MENTRLFTFGCSHTKYRWPSWADILGLNCKEFYNFGRPGTGIFYMIYQFTFANQHFKFNKNDTLIFMLSDEARVDIIKDKNWLVSGLVFNSVDVFGKKFFEHYSLTHAIESTYVHVYFLKEILDKIGCKYEIIYAFPPPISIEDDTPLTELWKKTFNLTNTNIKSLTEFAKNENDKSYTFKKNYGLTAIDKLFETNVTDGHYTITCHLNYIKKYLSKYYNEKYDDVVIKWENSVPVGGFETEVVDKFYYTINKNKVEFINGKKHIEDLTNII